MTPPAPDLPAPADPVRPLPRPLAGLALMAVAGCAVLLLGWLVARLPFAPDRAIVAGLRAWGGPSWLPPMISPMPGASTSIAATVLPSSFKRM